MFHRSHKPSPWKPPQPPQPLDQTPSRLGVFHGSPAPDALFLGACPECGSSERIEIIREPSTRGLAWFNAGLAKCGVCGKEFGIVED